jgi:hypothetical protein
MDENGDPRPPYELCDAEDKYFYTQKNKSGEHLGLG